MTLTLDVPGMARLEVDVLLLDVNGTLTDRGMLIDGVAERISTLRATFAIHLLSADTYGTLDEVARMLEVEHLRAVTARDKAVVLESLGAARSVVIGNGANDADVLAAAALGIAVIGPEGARRPIVRAHRRRPAPARRPTQPPRPQCSSRPTRRHTRAGIDGGGGRSSPVPECPTASSVAR